MRTGLATLMTLALTPGLVSCTSPAEKPRPTQRTMVLESEPLVIDRILTSMQGPFHRSLVDSSALDWVTAVRMDVIDVETQQPMGDEFFCHSQLQLLNGTRLMVTFTGAQEIRFPTGFGMPVNEILLGVPASKRALTFLGMVLNNHEPEIDRRATIRATIEYLKDEDLNTTQALTALYVVGMAMMVENLDQYVPKDGPVNDDVTTHCVLVNGDTVHWMVPPGPQLTRKRFRGLFPVEATVHYAVAHMHNHGVYVRFTDVTTGTRLFQTNVVYEPDRIQISAIPTYSSSDGFRVYPDHQYELEVFYDNTSDSPVDAMATMSLYYHPTGGEKITYPVGPDE